MESISTLRYGIQKYTLEKQRSIAIVWRDGLPEPNDFIAQLLRNLPQYTFLLAPQQKPLGNLNYVWMENLQDIQLILALGGDGTFLRAHRLFCETIPQVPIMGINFGQVGFLTCFESNQMSELIEKLSQGQITVACRPKLRAEVWLNQQKLDQFEAVNDVVLERGDWPQLLPFELSTSDTPVAEIKADGVVVSTALGSTAYNLAGGGPLLHPDCAAWCVTFIAPHSLSVRPMVLPMNVTYRLKIGALSRNPHYGAYLVVDGQRVVKVTPQHEVIITLSPHRLLIARRGHNDEIQLWRQKLGFGLSHL